MPYAETPATPGGILEHVYVPGFTVASDSAQPALVKAELYIEACTTHYTNNRAHIVVDKKINTAIA